MEQYCYQEVSDSARTESEVQQALKMPRKFTGHNYKYMMEFDRGHIVGGCIEKLPGM